MMADPKIATRVERLQRQKDRAVLASSLSDREKVLEKLRYFMDHAEPSDGPRIRAAELLGKSVGLFKEVQVQEQPRSVEEIEAEIGKLLAKHEDQSDDAAY